jgi:DDB1- and CUL4-associated factor 13
MSHLKPKMKVRVISRSSERYERQTSSSVDVVKKNPDPALHPFERAREYVRALNATKVDALLARPFVGALTGHRDGVYCLRRHPKDVSLVASGSGDGEVRLWNLPGQKVVFTVLAHQGIVGGVSFAPEHGHFVSCATDKTVKLWDGSRHLSDGVDLDYTSFTSESATIDNVAASSSSSSSSSSSPKPLRNWLSEYALTSVDHQRNANVFATAGASTIQCWSYERSEPIEEYSWGSATVSAVRFNPVQTNVLAATTSDCDIAFYDVRGSTGVRKVRLGNRSNDLCWNPMEAFNFTVANEDNNLYSFDMRNLNRALAIHKDHVSAVMCLDYAPTGQEFVSGSYDRTLRIFPFDGTRSREVYHTRRMQRVFGVAFSGDANFVMSASDDTNIRIWKARASAQLGVLLPREKRKAAYNDQLKQRYEHMPEVGRIARHRHVPKPIYQAQRRRHFMAKAERRKEHHRFMHSKAGTRKLSKERERVLREIHDD